VKHRQNRRNAASSGETFHVISEIDVAESISSDRFTTGRRINALTTHTQTLLSCLKQTTLDRLPSSLERYIVFIATRFKHFSIFSTFLFLGQLKYMLFENHDLSISANIHHITCDIGSFFRWLKYSIKVSVQRLPHFFVLAINVFLHLWSSLGHSDWQSV